MPTLIEPSVPTQLADADLRPRGPIFPSATSWRDQVLYFVLPDRFSDGREATRPRFDFAVPDTHRAPDQRRGMDAGKRFQGGTLKGVESKLPHLRDLGVTTLWVGPIWRQRGDLETYHGYGIQTFLDVDPRFGTRQDLRDAVDAAHALGVYVILDIIYNHSADLSPHGGVTLEGLENAREGPLVLGNDAGPQVVEALYRRVRAGTTGTSLEAN